MNFKRFNDIGDSEPRAWNKVTGTKFAQEEDDDDDEIPVPYCDEFEDDEESEEENEEEDTETETDSVTSSGRPVKRVLKNISLVLQEESDFMVE